MALIWRRNLAFFFTTFFCAGTRNMISQLFYDQYYPAQKNVLLSVTLLLGAAATLLGMGVPARRWPGGRRPLAAMVVLAVLAFCVQVLTSRAAAYIAAVVVGSFSVNFLFNVFDNTSMAAIGGQHGAKHIRSLLLYQMLGYMLAPLFFSQFFGMPAVCVAVVAGLAAASYRVVLREYGGAPAQAARRAARPPFAERFFLLYTVFVFSCVFILLSISTYLFKDYLRFANYALVSSLFLLFVVAVTAAGIVLSGFLPNAAGKGTLSIGVQAAAVGAMLAGVLILLLWPSNSYGFLAAPCVLFGLGYGVVMNTTKAFANCTDRGDGLISRYNIAQTVSSVLAYVLTLLASLAAGRWGLDVMRMDLLVLAALFTVALGMLPALRRLLRVYTEGGNEV